MPVMLWDLTHGKRKVPKMSNTTDHPHIAFIKAQWHADIVDRALEGFVAEAKQIMPDATVEVFDVPGAFEMPLLAKKLASTERYDAVVAAALVVDGGIYRHDFVASAVVTGLMNVQLETGVPVFSVSLTPHNFQPVDALISFFSAHFVKKGAEAAHAVAKVLELDARLAAQD